MTAEIVSLATYRSAKDRGETSVIALHTERDPERRKHPRSDQPWNGRRSGPRHCVAGKSVPQILLGGQPCYIENVSRNGLKARARPDIKLRARILVTLPGGKSL